MSILEVTILATSGSLISIKAEKKSNSGLLSIHPFVELCRAASDHPFWNEMRMSIVHRLVKELGLLDNSNVRIFKPREATDSELALFHSEDYILSLKLLSDKGSGQNFNFGFGTGDCPIFPNVHEASSLLVGGHLELADSLLLGEISHAVALIGGLHHAHRERASGFCYYNDPVIIIKHILKRKPDWRVLYLDFDCHHGDGVQAAFYDSSQVLTVSFHESGQFLYPGTGFVDEIGEDEGEGFNVNVPLPPFCGDSLYFDLFEKIVPSLSCFFRPDLIYIQAGTDTHYSDPITHLRLTNHVYKKITIKTHEIAHKYSNGRLFLAGGGGYNPDSTARAWTLMTMILSGNPLPMLPLPQKVPHAWVKYCREKWGMEAKESLMDDQIPEDLSPELKDYSTKMLKALKKFIFTLLEKKAV